MVSDTDRIVEQSFKLKTLLTAKYDLTSQPATITEINGLAYKH